MQYLVNAVQQSGNNLGAPSPSTAMKVASMQLDSIAGSFLHSSPHILVQLSHYITSSALFLHSISRVAVLSSESEYHHSQSLVGSLTPSALSIVKVDQNMSKIVPCSSFNAICITIEHAYEVYPGNIEQIFIEK